MAENENETVDNDGIADAIHKALGDDENLSDDDRRGISEKLLEKHGGTVPPVVKPNSTHWTDKKLW